MALNLQSQLELSSYGFSQPILPIPLLHPGLLSFADYDKKSYQFGADDSLSSKFGLHHKSDRASDLLSMSSSRSDSDSSSTLSPPSTRENVIVSTDQKRKKELVKDDAYWERRRKNNDAAKRSRDTRRQKEDEMASRAANLEHENMLLKIELDQLRAETDQLRTFLLPPTTTTIKAPVALRQSFTAASLLSSSSPSVITPNESYNSNNSSSAYTNPILSALHSLPDSSQRSTVLVNNINFERF